MQSAIYTGTVRHRRRFPRAHHFRYKLFMLYLDLAELPSLFNGSLLWSGKHPAIGWFRRKDFLGDPEIPLDTAVRNLVESETGRRPQGPVRLLTNLRYFGMLMNPISCYYIFDETGEKVETIVAEVTNTPWREKRAYVLPVDPEAKLQRTSFDKTLHVSPFYPMNMRYHWKGRQPADHLGIHLELFEENLKQFDATLSLERQPLSRQSLRALLWQYPWMTMKIFAAIYWQALRLASKRTPFYRHTVKQQTPTPG